jgi:hypothetical protein
MYMTEGGSGVVSQDQACDQCGHLFDPHMLLAGESSLDGGIIVCPVNGCNCFATWGPNGLRPDPTLVEQLSRYWVDTQGVEPSPEEVHAAVESIRGVGAKPQDLSERGAGADSAGSEGLSAPYSVETDGRSKSEDGHA